MKPKVWISTGKKQVFCLPSYLPFEILSLASFRIYHGTVSSAFL